MEKSIKEKTEEILKRKYSIKNENIIVTIILIIFATLVTLQSSLSILNTQGQLSIDVAVWTSLAQLMEDGKIIYRDIFDHKGPILLLLYYISYAIGKNVGIWMLDYICTLVNVFVIYKIARKFELNKIKSLIVVGISMAFLSFLCLENPCTESIALPFTLISLYHFIKFTKDINNFGNKESIYTGLCLGIVLLIRPNLASLWVIYDLYIFIKLLKEKHIKQLLKIIGFSVLGAIIAFLPIMLYLLINNAFKDFIDTYLIFNLKYSAFKDFALLQTIKFFISDIYGKMLLAVLAIYVILIPYIYIRKRGEKILITLITSFIFFVFTFYLVVMPGRTYIHYLIPMIPALIIPIILALKYINLNKNIGKIIIVLLFILMCYNLRDTIDSWNEKYLYKTYLEGMARYVQMNTDENANVLQLGNEANVYLMTDRQYKGKYIYQFPIVLYYEETVNIIIEDIKNNMPDMIVDIWKVTEIQSDETVPGKKFKTEITEILEQNYEKINNTIYVRKGE